MHFAPESVKIVLPVFIGAAFVLVWAVVIRSFGVGIVGAVMGVLGFTLLAFFRNPERAVPTDETVVVAPADGRIIEANLLPDGRRHVAIFLSVFNVHVNRAPVTARVTAVTTTPGTYFHAGSERAAQGNARVDVEGTTDYGPVAWRQVSGVLARKISCRLQAGDDVRRGDVFGLIYFGSRMDVFLPPCATLAATVGRHVRAGETVIARFEREEQR
jgi:phosphatidylserine decarboxylase